MLYKYVEDLPPPSQPPQRRPEDTCDGTNPVPEDIVMKDEKNIMVNVNFESSAEVVCTRTEPSALGVRPRPSEVTESSLSTGEEKTAITDHPVFNRREFPPSPSRCMCGGAAVGDEAHGGR